MFALDSALQENQFAKRFISFEYMVCKLGSNEVWTQIWINYWIWSSGSNIITISNLDLKSVKNSAMAAFCNRQKPLPWQRFSAAAETWHASQFGWPVPVRARFKTQPLDLMIHGWLRLKRTGSIKVEHDRWFKWQWMAHMHPRHLGF